MASYLSWVEQGAGDPHQALDMWARRGGRYGYLSLRNGCVSPACLFLGTSQQPLLEQWGHPELRLCLQTLPSAPT